jgi:hypothetical protein
MAPPFMGNIRQKPGDRGEAVHSRRSGLRGAIRDETGNPAYQLFRDGSMPADIGAERIKAG